MQAVLSEKVEETHNFIIQCPLKIISELSSVIASLSPKTSIPCQRHVSNKKLYELKIPNRRITKGFKEDAILKKAQRNI